jgi:hypothetical protein
MGIDAVGWGTAVTKDRVCVMDFSGKPVATENDFPFKEKFLGLMGIGVSASGDVWIADGSDNQLLFFPGGRFKDGRIVKVAGLKSPFDIVIDDQNRVWVANSSSDTVVRFPANDPSKVETFHAGIGVRALALDSKGNVWVANNMDLKTPQPMVVVIELLSGSRSTSPQLPVTGSIRFGVFPAAIRNPSGFPDIDSPLRNRAAVKAEATVVSSFTVTVVGGEAPSSASSATASLLFVAAFSVPPFATRYRTTSLPGVSALRS